MKHLMAIIIGFSLGFGICDHYLPKNVNKSLTYNQLKLAGPTHAQEIQIKQQPYCGGNHQIKTLPRNHCGLGRVVTFPLRVIAFPFRCVGRFLFGRRH